MTRMWMLGAAAAIVAMPVAAQTMAPADYVKMAGASDLYERQSSELVLQSTRNPEVRRFANMMIAHHRKSTADVTAAAKRARVAIAPPMLMPPQAEMIAQLRAAQGTARDTAYLTQQRTAHDQALALHQGYARDGSAAPLKAAAAKIVPVVSSHIAMLKRM